jgi:DNA-directed RNA polymerase subunit RPC12/RpoP
MVEVVCAECGTRQGVSILQETECEECGADGRALEPAEQ